MVRTLCLRQGKRVHDAFDHSLDICGSRRGTPPFMQRLRNSADRVRRCSGNRIPYRLRDPLQQRAPAKEQPHDAQQQGSAQ
jgi:hypothetical protein